MNLRINALVFVRPFHLVNAQPLQFARDQYRLAAAKCTAAQGYRPAREQIAVPASLGQTNPRLSKYIKATPCCKKSPSKFSRTKSEYNPVWVNLDRYQLKMIQDGVGYSV